MQTIDGRYDWLRKKQPAVVNPSSETATDTMSLPNNLFTFSAGAGSTPMVPTQQEGTPTVRHTVDEEEEDSNEDSFFSTAGGTIGPDSSHARAGGLWAKTRGQQLPFGAYPNIKHKCNCSG